MPRSRTALADRGIAFRTCKEPVVFERAEVMTRRAAVHGVQPYRNAWLKALAPSHLAPHDVAAHGRGARHAATAEDRGLPALAAMGFEARISPALGSLAGMPRRCGALRGLQGSIGLQASATSRGQRSPYLSVQPALRHGLGARARRIPPTRVRCGPAATVLATGCRSHLARVLRADSLAPPHVVAGRSSPSTTRSPSPTTACAHVWCEGHGYRSSTRDAAAEHRPATCTTACA